MLAMRDQRMISRYKSECGCKLGGIFAVSAIVICVPYVLLSISAISLFAGIKLILWSAVVIVAAGLVGKAIGIGVARIRLWLYIARH